MTRYGKVIRLLVDAVSDVLSIQGEDILPAPDMDQGLDSRYISGIGCWGERLMTLLDIEKVLGKELLS